MNARATDFRIFFEFAPGGHGLRVEWRDVAFAQYPLNVHLAPPVGNLLRGALQIATGGENATIRFEAEPYEWRWIAKRYLEWSTGRALFVLEVLEFEDYAKARPDAEGKVLFHAELDPKQFTTAVADMGQRLWESVGARYGEPSWPMGEAPFVGFPLRSLRALQAALTTDEPESPLPDGVTFTRII
jgi:hypothetical protein